MPFLLFSLCFSLYRITVYILTKHTVRFTNLLFCNVNVRICAHMLIVLNITISSLTKDSIFAYAIDPHPTPHPIPLHMLFMNTQN